MRWRALPPRYALFGVRIEREFKCLLRVPRSLPRGRALCQHLDYGICDFLPEVPLDDWCFLSHWIRPPVQGRLRETRARSPSYSEPRRPRRELFADRPRLPKL